MRGSNDKSQPSCSISVLTPFGEGGIGVIEVTGTGAVAVLEPLFRNPHGRTIAQMRPGDLLYGLIQEGDAILDEVLVCRRPLAANTPNEPPTFEINCHGGILPLRRVLLALQAAGARLNPRGHCPLTPLDVVQKEAWERLPDALTPAAAKMLLRQMQGALSLLLRQYATALETSLSPEALPPDIMGLLAALRQSLVNLAATARHGRALLEPIRVVLVGRPNVGKSSLFNALLGEERVLTAAHPGTTRDWVQALAVIAEYPVHLVDTAGIRVRGDALELLGAHHSRRQIDTGDVILWVLDRSQLLTPEDEAILALEGLRHRPLVPVLNKADLPPRLADCWADKRLGIASVTVSAKTGAGLAVLRERIVTAAGLRGTPREVDGAVVFTERQSKALAVAVSCLERALANDAVRDEAMCGAIAALRNLVGDQPDAV